MMGKGEGKQEEGKRKEEKMMRHQSQLKNQTKFALILVSTVSSFKPYSGVKLADVVSLCIFENLMRSQKLSIYLSNANDKVCPDGFVLSLDDAGAHRQGICTR